MFSEELRHRRDHEQDPDAHGAVPEVVRYGEERSDL